MKIAHMKVEFDGLYFWGSGWDMKKKALWDEFWKNLESTFWSYFEKDELFQVTQYLVTTYGSVYLHPMGFDVAIRQVGGTYRHTKDGREVQEYPEFDELKEICGKCADFCECGVKFSEVKVGKVEF